MKFQTTILAALFLFLLANANAQQGWEIEKIDYPAIEQAISKKKSPYFFKKLFQRYEALDTTLTKADFRHLYYGYTFQDEYSSMARLDNPVLDSLFQLEILTEADYRQVIEQGTASLQSLPFDLELIYIITVTYAELGDEANAEIWSHRTQGLLDAILSTGDGLELETAIHVIAVNHEYFLLDILGFKAAGDQELYFPCDYLKVRENDFGIEGLYFNVERHFAYMEKVFGGKK